MVLAGLYCFVLHGIVYVESSLLNAADVRTMNVSLDRGEDAQGASQANKQPPELNSLVRRTRVTCTA